MLRSWFIKSTCGEYAQTRWGESWIVLVYDSLARAESCLQFWGAKLDHPGWGSAVEVAGGQIDAARQELEQAGVERFILNPSNGTNPVFDIRPIRLLREELKRRMARCAE